jgi:heterotetrameric sarcosine oxidase delta subunit
MAFLIDCPNCGDRDVYEFRFGGEVTARPEPDASESEWTRYFYLRRNVAGEQHEWWYHSFGCRKWFVAVRDTVSNEVRQTFWLEEAHA